MKWVVQIMLTDKTWVLHGPFEKVEEANRYAKRYVELHPQTGTEVQGLHLPWRGI